MGMTIEQQLRQAISLAQMQTFDAGYLRACQDICKMLTDAGFVDMKHRVELMKRVQVHANNIPEMPIELEVGFTKPKG